MTSQEKGRSDPNHIELTRAGIFMALLISIDSPDVSDSNERSLGVFPLQLRNEV